MGESGSSTPTMDGTVRNPISVAMAPAVLRSSQPKPTPSRAMPQRYQAAASRARATPGAVSESDRPPLATMAEAVANVAATATSIVMSAAAATVEDDDGRVAEQGGGDAEALGHAEGEAAGAFAG